MDSRLRWSACAGRRGLSEEMAQGRALAMPKRPCLVASSSGTAMKVVRIAYYASSQQSSSICSRSRNAPDELLEQWTLFDSSRFTIKMVSALWFRQVVQFMDSVRSKWRRH